MLISVLHSSFLMLSTSDEIRDLVIEKKEYSETPTYKYVQGDYTKELPLKTGGFDLMISQYAGFISRACYKYLKIERENSLFLRAT